MIIDVHTHLGKLPNSKFENVTFEESLNFLLEEMKESKVGRAFILPSYDTDENNPPMEKVLKLTDGIEEINVVGTIDVLNYGQNDLDRLEELSKQKRIVGVKLYPGYQHFYPYEDKCKPIYELCMKFDMPVIFHSGDTLTTFVPKAKVKYSHPLHIDDVATDFPNLKIVIAHLGGPWFIDCAEVLYKNENVYADLSGLIETNKGEGLNSPYGETARRKINELIYYAGSRKLLYGTDWPLTPMKPYMEFVKKLDVSKDDLEYIFYKNAVELFKIKI